MQVEAAGMFEYQGTDPWYFRVEGNQVKWSGTKPGASSQGTSPGNGFVDLSFPVDYVTRNLSVEAGYKTRQMHLDVSLMTSKFENDNETIDWTNGYFGRGTDRTYLAADNKYTRLAANATFRQLPLSTTVAARYTNDELKSDVPLGTSMLNGTGVPVRKVFVVNGQQYYYRNRQQPGTPIRDAVRVFYNLRNDDASGLGIPMPAGVVRVYQADSRGGVQFAGEDRIVHTPKDENLSLQIGTAFDIVCDRRQTEFTRIADNIFEMAYELRLRNHKTSAITVEVNEPLAGDWQMLSSSHASRKTDAFAAQFQVPVAASEESILRYRVRVRY